MLLSGLSAFHAAHQAVYKTRWLRSLYPALLQPHPSVAVLNRHLPPRQREQARQALLQQGAHLWRRSDNVAEEIEAYIFDDEHATRGEAEAARIAEQLATTSLQHSAAAADSVAANAAEMAAETAAAAAAAAATGRFIPPSPLDATSPLLPYYLLDGASLLAVDALQVQPEHAVLDLCAAPGGKSVCIAQRLDLQTPADASLSPAASGAFGPTAARSMLHANEVQGTRRVRLQRVLDEYLPGAIRGNRARVEVTPWDATRVALPQGRYDRVLVDAPCSSDRHVLQSAGELAAWSVKRIKTNAERQVALLLNALRAVKPGGICVYATCSLSRRENDEVVQAVLDKLQRNARNNAGAKGAQRLSVKVLPIRLSGQTGAAAADPEDEDVLYLPMGEPTKLGWMVLPDQVAAARPVAPQSTDAASAAAAAEDAAAPAAAAAASTPAAVSHGFGPLYFCRIKRLASGRSGGGAGSDDDDDDDSDDSEDSSSEGEEEPRPRPSRQLPPEEADEHDQEDD
jgi:16S rRNA C967 or C1407 C5-methylase (RsmB/RsmF family)